MPNTQGKKKIFTRIGSGLFTVFILLIVPLSVTAKTPVFGTVFSSNMVLPHGKAFILSGYASPDTALVLEVDNRTYRLKSNANGEWRTIIEPLSAGGPYRIKISDKSGAESVLENVLAGNVWLCSGQSNMAYPVAASVDQPESFNQGHFAIRLLSVPLRAEVNPQKEFADPVSWQNATNENVKNFSAVCYFFGREMVEQDGIPIGLINASWGGSAIEAWISEENLAKVTEYTRNVEQLRQYRRDSRGAELAFAKDWMNWWHSASDQGPVWEKGVLDKKKEWIEAPLQDWKTYPDERLENHHGMLWFSRSFELTREQQAKDASFVLGKIDEVDSTWINGRFVNNSFGYGTRREYSIEPSVLKKGANQITVNVLNTWGAGGMTGPAEEVGIRFDDGEFLPLGTDWHYLFIPAETGFPPRSPWESVSGITGLFNGMISPLDPLRPEGVIWYQGESNTESSHTYQGLLSALIADWRGYFEGDFPFIIVQLPNYGMKAAAPAESGWARVRHVQQQTALKDDMTGLVVTHDAGNDADIHPNRKWIVGIRAARVAKALDGRGAADGVVPAILGMDSRNVILEFAPPLEPWEKEKEIEGFSLCSDAKESCVFTKAVQIGSRVRVSLEALPEAAKIRYCWSDGGVCMLKAVNGLPVSSFEIILKPGL